MRDKPTGGPARAGVYVDGYNLYYSLRRLGGRRYLWLDLAGLAARLLREDQVLEAVRYFTAPVRRDPGAVTRQRRYLAALECGGALKVVLGRFQEKRMRCRDCGACWRTYEEKQTDVAIATAMVADVALDRVDVVLLISADSDLCAAVHTIREIDAHRGTKTRIVTVFPPGKSSDRLRGVSDAWFPLGEAVIRRCQLPDVVRGGDGSSYRRPSHWS
ncbi:NYN domain-containing protein [Planomonospora sp. ID67723]|uniref:NYN domain-containing protein n=1 Tax=Planomonospora sp. ID67723 TaxID=2738134 RepID=UPI0018C39264|nr:NYN domain-containing protein [Planomonospora sp. ID67723]MBG0830892.1 NYN domain-containing protein [Planomonospora sp. ID67723]